MKKVSAEHQNYAEAVVAIFADPPEQAEHHRQHDDETQNRTLRHECEVQVDADHRADHRRNHAQTEQHVGVAQYLVGRKGQFGGL